MSRWPPPVYNVRVSFDAPVGFVFRWCTDYTPHDARLEKDNYQRKIIERRKDRVVYEDLSETPEGWFWSRNAVALDPPNHWHSKSVGSHREYDLDYRLRELPSGRTELHLRALRRPMGTGGKNPERRGWERSVAQSWRNFRKALERDYQKQRRRRPAK